MNAPHLRLCRSAAAALLVLALATNCGPTKEEPEPTPPPAPDALPKPTFRVDATLQPGSPTVPGIDGGAERPLESVRDAKGHQVDFVRDELVVLTSDAQALQRFASRWGGQVLQRTELSKAGLAMPDLYLVKVSPAAADPALLPDTLRQKDAKARGEHTVSSEGGLKLIAAAVQEAGVDGLNVGLNLVARSTGFGTRSLADGVDGAGDADWSPNAFQWPYMRTGGEQDIGVAEAWRTLELTGALSRRVKVAVLDAGFVVNPDFPARRTIHPAGAYDIPNGWGCSTGPGCGWHGTSVVQALAGLPDNGFGAAGPAGPVADLVLIQSPSADVGQLVGYASTVLSVFSGADRPRIVNMSFGFSLPAGLFIVGNLFDLFTGALHGGGTMVFGAADNWNRDVDALDEFLGITWENAIHMPCESAYVTCVGGLEWNRNVRAITAADRGSNWGSNPADPNSVDLYGPYFLWAAQAVEAGNPLYRASGTSVATPFVAGVAALVMAANPALSVDQVSRILMETAHTGSPDRSVHRWVNALGAVRRALSEAGTTVCEAPRVSIGAPASGTRVYAGRAVDFSGAGVDLAEGGRAMGGSELRWFDDGVAFGTGTALNRTFSRLGAHTIKLVGSNCSAVDGEATIALEVIDHTAAPGTAAIRSPENDASFLVDTEVGGTWFASVTLTGEATYVDGTPVPDARLRWRSNVEGVLGTGGQRVSRLRSELCSPTVHTVTLEVLNGDGTSVLTNRSIQVRIQNPPC